MGFRVRAAARPLLVSLGPPAGLLLFATMPHRTGDASLEPEGPWADHSSFRKSSSESVSAVKVVNSGKSRRGRGLVSVFRYLVVVTTPGYVPELRAPDACGHEQPASHLLLQARPLTSYLAARTWLLLPGLGPSPSQPAAASITHPTATLANSPSSPGVARSLAPRKLFPLVSKSLLGPVCPTGLHPGPGAPSGEGRALGGRAQVKLFSPKY